MRVVAAIRTAGVCLAGVLLAADAGADAVKDCNSNNLDRRIKGCTSALKSGKLSKRNKALAYAWRGDAYVKKENYDAAFADFTTCLELSPSEGACRSGLSVVRCHTAVLTSGDVAGVEEHCAYLKNSPTKAQQAYFYNLLGIAHFGRYQFGQGSADPSLGKALDSLNKSIAIGAEIGTVTADDYDFRGVAYLQNKREPGGVISKDANKALEDFNAAIALDPSQAKFYLHRGYAHNQLLEPEAAWADFQKARELDPSDPAILDAYEKQRKYSPEGQAEIRRQLDEILRPSPKE
ncbi:hypothetical protein [Hyphomicrobium sp.]|uniref:tetratricopeptide repeat protein n=1 Tax=Hyphomicrobium sp. TaxID=82 RepID=UPI0025BA8A82|nr:hypothetical protein [Hyphomicrobium sp.]MCC7253199.1 hypothetical protein [Hyphomicrobium sp.]